MNNYVVLAKLTDLQLAFVIIVPIVVLLFLVIALYFPISGAYRRKYFQIHFYTRARGLDAFDQRFDDRLFFAENLCVRPVCFFTSTRFDPRSKRKSLRP